MPEKPIYLILLGPPMSGKGTQAARLSGLLEVPQVSSGDLFRDNIKNQTELGKEAKAYIDRGDLVPDEITIGMVAQRLNQPDEQPKSPAGDEINLLDDADYSTLWGVLGHDPKPVDTIIEQTKLSAREVSSMLLMMELKGMVKKHANGRYVRA